LNEYENLTDQDKELLRTLQNICPIVPQPYLEIAKKLGRTEEQIISRLKQLVDSGIIRKFGAKISPRKIGYVSILVASNIPEAEIDSVADIINEYSGVTHNYIREGEPNLWFTLTEPDEDTLNTHLQEIEKRIGKPIIKLPATKIYKIGVKLDI
jgi:DNA-binding Lrp family transcriptional regulator